MQLERERAFQCTPIPAVGNVPLRFSAVGIGENQAVLQRAGAFALATRNSNFNFQRKPRVRLLLRHDTTRACPWQTSTRSCACALKAAVRRRVERQLACLKEIMVKSPGLRARDVAGIRGAFLAKTV